jgi:hypothetical protein
LPKKVSAAGALVRSVSWACAKSSDRSVEHETGEGDEVQTTHRLRQPLIVLNQPSKCAPVDGPCQDSSPIHRLLLGSTSEVSENVSELLAVKRYQRQSEAPCENLPE